MLVEKKLSVYFNTVETNTFTYCAKVIDDVIEKMKSYDCNEMYSAETGECVSLSDFCRMLGILTGLTNMTEIYYADFPTEEEPYMDKECASYDDCRQCSSYDPHNDICKRQ